MEIAHRPDAAGEVARQQSEGRGDVLGAADAFVRPRDATPGAEAARDSEGANLSLTGEQTRRVERAVAERNDQVGQEVADLKKLADLAGRFRGEDGSPRIDGRAAALDRAEPGLAAALDARMEEYLASKAGATDRQLAQLRAYKTDPTPERREQVAEMLGVELGGWRARLQSTHAERQERQLAEAVSSRIQQLAPSSDARSARFGASMAIRELTDPALQDASSASEAFSGDLPRGDASPGKLAERLTRYEARVQEVGAELTELVSSADIDRVQPALSALAKGYTTKKELVGDMRGRGSKVPLHMALRQTLDDAEFRAKEAFAEPSLAGMSFTETEAGLVRSFEEQAGRLREVLGAEPPQVDLATQVTQKVEKRQAEFGDYIDKGDTLYVHFTSHGSKIFRTGELRPAVHKDVVHAVNKRASKGVHFIKPGTFRGTENVRNYMQYARWTKTAYGKPIENPLGVALVYPLRSLVTTTPVRNEHKTTSPTGEHLSPDATFRTAEGTTDYAYPVGDAFVVPCYTRDQVPIDRRVIGVDERGKTQLAPYAEPVKQALRDAGYDEAWIAERVIDVPTSGSVDVDYMRLACAEIQRRLASANGQTGMVVPLTARPGRLEHLDDLSGTSKRGDYSRPHIEHLAVVEAVD